MESAKILIVEDEKIVARDIENRLKSFGYAVAAVVSTGEAAIKKAAETRPDLVLMDILLKGDMDGVKAAEQIHDRFDIPIIYLTAFADDKTLQRAKITEPYGYIIKPFEERELRTTIEIALYKHTMERKTRESEKRYKDLFSSTLDGVYRVDARSVFVLANQACAEIFGHQSPGDLIGRSDREYWVDSHERDAFRAELKAGKSVKAYPIRARKIDGTIIHLETSSHVMEDSDGSVVGVEGIFRNVTGRKDIEKALAEEKKISDAAIQSLPGIFYLFDKHGKFLKWNRNLELVSGYSSEEISRMAPLEFFVGEDRRIEEEHIQRVFQEGQSTSEANLVTKDGRRILFFFTCGMIMIGDSKCAVGVGLDITERKKAEEALRKSEESYRNLVETMSEGLAVQDKNGLITFMNKRGCAMLGYELEELIGKPTTLVFDEENQEILREQMAQRREGKRQSYEIAWTRKDGGKIFTIIAPSPLFDERGNYEGSIAVFTDITERKQAEEALQKSEEFLQSSIRVAKLGIFDHDQRTDTIYWSPRQREIHGWGPEEPVTLQAFLSLVHPEDAERIASTVQRAHDPAGDGSWDVEHRIIRRDGTIRWLAARSQTFFEGEGSARRPVRTVGAVIDITERKKIEEQIFRISHDWEDTFNSITDMITVHDKDFNIVHANKAAEKILGLPFLEKTPDAKCFRYYHGTEKPPEGCPSCGCLQTGKAATFELFEPHLNMFIEIRAIPRFDSNNQLIGLIHVVRDISERKKVEDKLTLLFEEVSKGKMEWEMTFDSAMEIIVLIDKELNIIRCNKSCADFCGRPVDTIPGHKFFDLFPWSPDDMEYFRDKVQKEEPTEWIETKTTTGRWFYLSHRPIADRKGDFLYSVIIATDITGLKSAQEKIQESEEALKERVKELERFYEMAVGRELKMKELKKEIAGLKAELENIRK
jgi:PAS domain S-box-containing protein